MARVPRLNKRILPQQLDAGAISRAGQVDTTIQDVAGGLSQAAEIGVKFQQAKDASLVSSQSTTYERDVDQFFRDSQVEFANDPDGNKVAFDKYMNERYNSIDKEGMSTQGQALFNALKDDVQFKYGQKYDDFAKKQNIANFGQGVEQTVQDASTLAYRAGQSGEPLDDQLDNIDKATIAGSAFLPAGELQGLNDEGRNAVIESYLHGMMETDPSAAKALLDSGKYDDDLSPKQTKAFKTNSKNMFHKRVESEKTDVLIGETLKFPEEAEKFYSGAGTGAYTILEAEAFKKANPDSPLGDYMINELTIPDSKKPKPPLNKRLDVWNSFSERAKSFLITKGVADNASIIELQKYQDDLAVAANKGEITAGEFHTFSNQIMSPMMNMVATNETGISEQEKSNFWAFGNGIPDPITPALNKIDDYLEKNDRADDILFKKNLVNGYLSALKIDEYSQAPRDYDRDSKAIDNAIDQAIKAAVVDDKPVLLGLGGTPNSIVDEEGKTTVSSKESDLKPKAKVTAPFKIMEDANGNRARVYEDGRVEEIN